MGAVVVSEFDSPKRHLINYIKELSGIGFVSARPDKSEVKSRINPSEICMMADDLAGACDTGIEFLDTAGCVTVVIDSDMAEVKKNEFEGLVVWNTESRSLAEHEACRKVHRACGIAGANKKRILLKKTDSALRGHFGREISAVMDALDLELCCVAPAIPDFGRVTRKGIQYLDGLPIAESFYSKDPKQPVTQSRIDEIVARGNTRPTGLFDLETLRSPENQEHLERLIASAAPADRLGRCFDPGPGFIRHGHRRKRRITGGGGRHSETSRHGTIPYLNPLEFCI